MSSRLANISANIEDELHVDNALPRGDNPFDVVYDDIPDPIEEYVKLEHKRRFANGTMAQKIVESSPDPVDAGYIIHNNINFPYLDPDVPEEMKDMDLNQIKEYDLVNNREWIESSKILYNQYNKGSTKDQLMRARGVVAGAIDEPEKDDEFYARWGLEFIGQMNYNISELGIRSATIDSVPEPVAMSLYSMMQAYDRLPDLTWSGSLRAMKGLLTDPTTYAGLGTLGIGLAARAGVKSIGKSAIMNALKSKLAPTTLAAFEGAGYAGVENLARQNVGVAAGAQEAIDFTQARDAALTGAAFGAGIGAAGEAIATGVGKLTKPKSGDQGFQAFHGSKYNFDKFDIQHLGSGEGKQAYGKGLYFSELEEIADRYAKSGERKIYEVRINANKDEMMDFNAPLSAQPESVKNALEPFVGLKISKMRAAGEERSDKELMDVLKGGDILILDSIKLYDDVVPGSISKALIDAGVPGVKHFEPIKRADEVPAQNFTVFDDGLVDIIKKYGFAGILAGAAVQAEMGDNNGDS
jgi:hypothetical protein